MVQSAKVRKRLSLVVEGGIRWMEVESFGSRAVREELIDDVGGSLGGQEREGGEGSEREEKRSGREWVCVE